MKAILQLVLLIGTLSPVAAVQAAGPGAGLCTVNQSPVEFTRILGSGSGMIVRGQAVLGEGELLLFEYNPFFDVGGSVLLKTPSVSAALLRWDNPFGPEIRDTTIRVGDKIIHCRYR